VHGSSVKITIVICICAIVFAVAAFILGAVIFVGPDGDRLPLLITSLLGVVAPTIAGMMALLKASENQAIAKDLETRLNGKG